MAAASAFMNLAGGFLQVEGAVGASRNANRQAELLMNEGIEKAKEKTKEVKKFRAQQAADFVKSGVILEGSPLKVLEETMREGFEDVKNIRRSARARSDQARAAGRDALTRGLAGGLASGMNAVAGFDKAGYFKKSDT